MTLKIKETSNNVFFSGTSWEVAISSQQRPTQYVGENDFMSQEQHLTCVRFCFVFVWVFFQHQMRGDDLNLLPIISPIFLYLQRNTDNSAFFLFRAASLRTSACASCIIPPQSAWPECPSTYSRRDWECYVINRIIHIKLVHFYVLFPDCLHQITYSKMVT